jgi:hypothetical protein
MRVDHFTALRYLCIRLICGVGSRGALLGCYLALLDRCPEGRTNDVCCLCDMATQQRHCHDQSMQICVVCGETHFYMKMSYSCF